MFVAAVRRYPSRMVGLAARALGERMVLISDRIAPPANPEAKGKKKKGRTKPGGAKPEQFWSNAVPMAVRAMVLAPDTLIIAGPPVVGKKSKDLLAFENEEDALAAFAGKKKASLVVVSTKDGSTLSQVKLDAVPVFDGMSAANGKLFISTKDGTVLCLGE